MKLYNLLNVSKDATMDEIKISYRKLANLTHPDKEGGDIEVFKAIQNAYNILSNSEYRKHYDETGEFNIQKDIMFQARVNEFLINITLQIIDNDSFNPEISDIVQLLKDNLNGQIVGHQMTINVITKKVNKRQKAINRLTKKNGENILSQAMTVINDGQLKIIEDSKISIAELQDMLIVVGDYTYDLV